MPSEKTDSLAPFVELFRSVQEAGFPSKPIELCETAVLFLGGSALRGDLTLHYDRKGTPRLCLTGKASDNRGALTGEPSTRTPILRFFEGDAGAEVLVTKRSFDSDNNFKLSAVPRRTPVSVGDAPISSVSAIIVNGPKGTGKDIEFEANDGSLHCRIVHEPSHSKDSGDDRLANGDYLATARMDFRFQDASHNEAKRWENVHLFSHELWVFLQFVTGRSVGIGGHIGFCSDGSAGCVLLGFTKCDPNTRSSNWYDWTLAEELQPLFNLFSSARQKSTLLKDVLTSACGLYRASEVIRESANIEIALTTTHTCLEVLVHYVLGSEAGWSNSILGSKTPFHDKLRAAAHFVKITADPLEYAPSVQGRSRSFGNADAFEMLSIYRNRLVHSGKEFDYDGMELLQAWQFGQWLCEIFVFYILGHRGKMADRRHLTRWIGTTVDIPIT